MHPAYTDEGTFRTLLGATEALARTHGKQELVVSVNGRHAWALEQLLKSGYRVVGVRVRMVMTGTDTNPSIDDYVNLSRWAG
jgi:hypothetical protein